MSSQGVNATEYSGFTLNNPPMDIVNGFPLRDSSDYTRALKNRSVYRDFFITPAIEWKNGEQSNESRLNFNFGLIACQGVCKGPFPKWGIPKQF